jgi:alpha-D-ribose 1-methylphosphonate 5-triphosphate synthase subunit PhnG
MAGNFLQKSNFQERHFSSLKKCKGQRVWRKPQLGIMQVRSRWQGTFSRTISSEKDKFFCDKMQTPKSVEKTTIGNNAGREYIAGKHKKKAKP